MKTAQDELMTSVNQVLYDFEQGLGVVYLPDRCCTDMSGAIRFFTRIDPKVRLIRTMVDETEDIVYMRTGSGWEARWPKGHRMAST
jgi:hypothetical protein